MSWPWNYPSESEAEEACEYYQRKYENAAYELRAAERKQQEYNSQKRSAVSRKNSLSEQKVNFEKRLEGIERIIAMLEGTGGLFVENVPETIRKAQKSLTKTDESFRASIRLSGGNPAPSFEDAFETKTVEADAHTAAALRAFKTEKNRLQQEIADLSAQISSLSDLIDSLNRKINSCIDYQAEMRSRMNNFAFDLRHYRKILNGM